MFGHEPPSGMFQKHSWRKIEATTRTGERRAKRERKKRKKAWAVDGEASPQRRRVLRSRAARSRARGRRCSCSRTPLQRRPRARPRTQSLASRATEHVKKRRAEPTLFSRTRKRKSASVRVRSTTRGQEPKIDMGRSAEMFRNIEKSEMFYIFSTPRRPPVGGS